MNLPQSGINNFFVEAQVKIELRLWLIKVPCYEDSAGRKYGIIRF